MAPAADGGANQARGGRYESEVKQIATSGTLVVSFRAPEVLIKRLDKLAEEEQRSRANLIIRILTKAVQVK